MISSETVKGDEPERRTLWPIRHFAIWWNRFCHTSNAIATTWKRWWRTERNYRRVSAR